MRIKKIIITAMFVASIALLTSCSYFNTCKVAVFPPSWMNLTQIDNNIYVEKGMNKELQKKLLAETEESKKYVVKIWGEIKSDPIIYACATKKCAKSLGRKARAHTVSNHLILKRVFGLDRCSWKGLGSFKSYVWASVVSANLLTLARKELA